jgi:hypothetical protein
MSNLEVSIAPKPGASVRDDVGTIFVDVVYAREIEDNTSVQETVRVALEEKLRGSLELTDVAPSTSIDFCFLAANGAVRLRKTVTPEARKPLTVSLTESEVATVTAKDPKPRDPSTRVITRRAYFVPVGDQPIPLV